MPMPFVLWSRLMLNMIFLSDYRVKFAHHGLAYLGFSRIPNKSSGTKSFMSTFKVDNVSRISVTFDSFAPFHIV